MSQYKTYKYIVGLCIHISPSIGYKEIEGLCLCIYKGIMYLYKTYK